MISVRLVAFASFSFASLLTTSAKADWLHYRGPTHNGIASESLPATLPKEPKTLWREKVGTGQSSVTIQAGRLFTAGNADKSHDAVYCMDSKTGKVIWKHEYPQELGAKYFDGGTRATPTVDGDRVYSLSHNGDLFCLDAATGKVRWYKHYVQDFGGRRPDWGFAGSPLVHGDHLICDVGGSGSSTVVLNKNTGALVWKSGSDQAGYGSPVVATITGKPAVVIFKATALVGYDVANGTELFRTEWKTSYDVNAITPVVVGDSILVSSGYGTGASLYKVEGSQVSRVWFQKQLRTQMNTPVVTQNLVFGIDGNNGGGNLVCLDFATGEEKWREKSVRGGSLILAGDKLVCLTEGGELVICHVAGDGFKLVLRNQVLDGRSWVQPTLEAGVVYAKNNGGDLAAVSLQ